MRRILLTSILAFFVLSPVAGCSLGDLIPSDAGPTPFPVPTPTPLPAAEVIFTVLPPEGTSAQDDLALVLLDEVTGLAYNTSTHPLKRLDDGRWQARLTPPVGSLLRYRYTRKEPTPADEASVNGMPIEYRVAQIPGPTQINDIVAAWTDTAFQGPVGRIIGRISESENGTPLAEMIVVVAGLHTFSDGEGTFRIEGIPPGLHQLTAFHPTGEYQTVQQGAVIAPESTTPVELSVPRARKVQVTFEVTVPSDTIPGTPLRIAGNVHQMGNTFGQLGGGLSLTSTLMPTATLVTPTNYLAVVTLYTGTDLRYKYTLGDGLWNAERDQNGFFVTRQLIVPDYDLIVKDTISSWHNGRKGSVQIYVTVPEDTPPSDQISLQFNPFTWFEPLPIWRLDENEWFYVLHGPLDFSGTVGYRYCRNLQCGSADDVTTASPNAPGRPISSASQELRDEVEEWWWMEKDFPTTTVIAPEINVREGFEVGVDLIPSYHPNWIALVNVAMQDVANMGANAIVLTPTWTAGQNTPLPIFFFDPTIAPFHSDLTNMIARAADHGLQVTLRPTLQAEVDDMDTWWRSATLDSAWWNVWFESYRSFLLTYAHEAQQLGVHRLVLGGVEIAPALPGGQVSGEIPSGVPQDAEERWRILIAEIRSTFAGKLALELELAEELQSVPNFVDAFDEIYVYWHSPLTTNDDATPSELQAAASSLLNDFLLSNSKLAKMPIYLSVEYLSVAGSAKSCAKAPDESCRPPSAFDQGTIVDPDIELDLLAQAEAINAVLLEATIRPEVMGFYVRRYNPTVALHDKSASINGKPARDVVWHWYTQLTGQR